MEIPASQGGMMKELKAKLGGKVKEGSLLLEAEVSATAPASARASNTNQAPASVMAQPPLPKA